MRSFGIMYWFLVTCILFLSQAMMAQDLQVLVLDALDGKPQINVDVRYFCMGPPGNSPSKKGRTNKDGIANISNFCNDKQKIGIEVNPPNKKEQCGDDAAMTVEDATSVGFVSKPDSAGGIWCPTKVSRTIKPVPGKVIIFVKKPTWWQSHVAG